MIFIDLIYNLALLTSLSVVSIFIIDKWKNRLSGTILQGVLFGGIALIGMLHPFNIGPGLIFDGRSVVVSLCSLFFGPVSGTIAFIMAASLRIYQGGAGAFTGILVLLVSTLIGLIFYYRVTVKDKDISVLNLLGIGIAVHIAMILLMFTLPGNIAFSVVKKIAFPVMLIFPAATVLIGRIIYDHFSRNKYMDAFNISESHLYTLVQTIPDLVWLKDKNGVYLACNTTFEKFFGSKEKDIVGKSDYDFVDKDLADFFRLNDNRAAEAGKPVVNEEWIVFADDGRKALLETIKTPMYDKSGKFIGVLGIGRDITERKKSEDRIRKLLTEKELLLKEVHHRIKNNMNTIKGLLTLQIFSENDPGAAESLKSAESRVNSMIMLYDRLYTTDNYRELALKDYLEPLAEEIVGSFPANARIELDTRVDDFILNVKILTPLGIIVNELITNIMKYAFKGRESGEIFLSAVLENRKVQLVISDNGVGIPESVDFGASTGFGLDLVKMLVDQIDGRIVIERGRGTRFVLEFPV